MRAGSCGLPLRLPAVGVTSSPVVLERQRARTPGRCASWVACRGRVAQPKTAEFVSTSPVLKGEGPVLPTELAREDEEMHTAAENNTQQIEVIEETRDGIWGWIDDEPSVFGRGRLTAGLGSALLGARRVSVAAVIIVLRPAGRREQELVPQAGLRALLSPQQGMRRFDISAADSCPLAPGASASRSGPSWPLSRDRRSEPRAAVQAKATVAGRPRNGCGSSEGILCGTIMSVSEAQRAIARLLGRPGRSACPTERCRR